MRLTYSDLWDQFQRNINAVGTNDANIKAEFNTALGTVYQLMLSVLTNYKTTRQSSFVTVTGAMPNSNPANQYYPYPEGEIIIEGITVTVGSVNFPLKIINSLYNWQQLNSILVQASALPQFYFPRADDFGIWPIPQAPYTGEISYYYRDRNLTIADYKAGSIAVTANSATIVGTSTTFTPAMVGRWFTVTDPTVSGQGYWYRISGYTDANHLTLGWPYTGTSASGVTYKIGETPEIPEEGHAILVDGVTAEFYAHMRKDLANASLFSNKFWTGDPNNKDRIEGNTKIAGGLIALSNRYSNREDTRVINKKPKLNPLQSKVWATSLS
jgi:hypothetical protein